MATVSVLGAGAWGTALAMVASRAGSPVLLWTRNENEARSIEAHGQHPTKLLNIPIDTPLHVTTDLKEACQAPIIILAAPAQEFRSFTSALAPLVNTESYMLIASKGIERETGLLLSEVGAQTMPEHAFSVLSGPTFADEVAQNLPTAVTLASSHMTTSVWLSRALNHSFFRVYASDDVIGVQVGGALKNILAIAAGMLEARGLGHNAQASLITRGLAEMTRLGVAKGANVATFSGLSGLGDLCLTCTSSKSRNRAFGQALGRMNSVAQASASFAGKTVEGVVTTASAVRLANMLEVEMPVCSLVNDILYNGMTVEAAIEQLLSRPLKLEATDERVFGPRKVGWKTL